ncbi:DUF3108 domain-containing protein [Pseudomonas sp. F1_0610]|uniref:DUF3108 domain-containing protein n=1 Tax=Pseudomonas sp. F1_0610 TaxID=3114284 RepID=UPI0039C2DF02
MRHVLLATTLSLVFASTTAIAEPLKPFFASYTADFTQLPFSGTAERSLTKEGNNWKLNFNAAMMLASLTEKSTFEQKSSTFVPLSYRYERSGLGSSKVVKQNFDWQAKRATGIDRKKEINVTLPSGTLDKSTYQIALQEDVAAGKTSMSYNVLDGDDLEVYDFRVLGSETVTTKVGKVEAIKVERVREPDQSQRKTSMWFAKDKGWDYILVQLVQVEKDGKEYQIVLQEGTVDGKKLKGQ